MDTNYTLQLLNEESAGCLLCENAPCTTACPHQIAIHQILQSLYFSNPAGAAQKLPDTDFCSSCTEKSCMAACLKGRITRPVAIDQVLPALASLSCPPEPENDPDLSIDFCDLHCENPFFLSSSVVGSNYEMISKAFDMGWAGVVYKTITSFAHEEVSPRFATTPGTHHGFDGFKNLEESSEHTLEENIAIMRRLKKDYPGKIVIASIMGQNEDDWTFLARELTKAGIDALECNFSCPHMAYDGLGTDVGEDPALVDRYVRAIKRGSNLPLIAKMTANITSVVPPAIAAVNAGADALAAINTIKSIVNVSGDTFSGEPCVSGKTAVGGYSGNAVHPIANRFVYDMAATPQLKNIPLSGTGGVENWQDALDFLLLGCTNIQITTAIMQYGYRIIDDLLSGLKHYLKIHHISNVRDIVGKAISQVVGADALDRETICYPKFNHKQCIGCGRCYISCYDGGHQALTLDENRTIRMNPKKCVGCHLCLKVCPAGAITVGTRVLKKKN